MPTDHTRLLRRTTRVLRLVLTLVGATAIALPVAAWAGHQFGDVPNSNTFHADIDWMKGTGVTKGCNPPANDQYCPDDFVTREQMAAFMHRLETEGVFLPPGGQAADADQLDGLDASDFLRDDLDTLVPVAHFNLVAGGISQAVWREPITAAPTASHDGSKWTVELPGASFHAGFDTVVCTPVGTTDVDVAIDSFNGDLRVYTFADNNHAAQIPVHCVVHSV